MHRLFSIAFALSFLLVSVAKGQGKYIDTIFQQAKVYNNQKPSSVLFAHLDKTVYVNNETIWFAAYLLNPDSNLLKHQVISVGLVNDNTQKLIVEAKYPMRGFADGNLIIPDTITPGNYSFIAITNLKVNGKPALRFVQPITIKTATQPPFTVSITLDTLFKDLVNTRVLINAKGPDGPLDKASVSYILGRNKDKSTRVMGEAKTNVLGSYTLLIPKNRINNLQHNLEVQVKHNKITKTVHLDIPVKKQINSVKFYPEGGNLVSGLISRVAWEAKTPAGTPIKASAVLYANSKPIDTIQTDSYGMGTFNISPTTAATYTAKLIRVKHDDVVYPLPTVLPAGVVMYMAESVANDTARLIVRSSFKGKFTLLVHNYREIFAAIDIDADKRGRSVKIDLSNMPRGLTTVTVLDSYQKPVAEHMFFAHYDHRSNINIKVDDRQPGLRQKMTVKLKLDPLKTKASSALVSVACVQDNRLEVKKDNNIEQYYYLRNEIENIPAKENLMGSRAPDRKYLNDLLLIRGWSKYAWHEMMKAVPEDTIRRYDEFAYNGTVLKGKDSVKRAMRLLLRKDSGILIMVPTDQNGDFALTNGNVFAQKTDNRMRIRTTEASADHTVMLTDQYHLAQLGIAKGIEPEPFDPPVTSDTKTFVFTPLKNATKLRQVNIKGKSDKLRGANDCGDYVCRYNILNCFNHPGDPENRPPKIGETLREAGGGGLIKYVHCGVGNVSAPGMTVFTGINNSKQYYGADYAVLNPLEPDYLSTVFWKHSVMLSKDKETELTFYTSDITGKFRIVVQGVTDKDVIYNEASFETIAKKDDKQIQP
ncbi:hypothetical protein [Mucilaginibacter myungsuensis]|uniref:MG2 domain-containing protein n=1 Tax=Mucilaginibacter myungsuensis TaxID=649104 RepID=A0A929KXZ8_9SPHI|nr:hypothetical protein [Mucilaginibacter myungsuensis]MBE9662590.1 hypothetical protein [Mucilaginibacter myungsuensis]MDN3598010.1 hypothetical protein [Mucilaginibacter myungsuensis]